MEDFKQRKGNKIIYRRTTQTTFFFKDIYISNTDFIKKERRAKP